jgi:hypothetical protein
MSNRSGSQGEIAIKAYDLYVKRGMTDGHDFDDWLQAEKIVMEQQAKIRKSKTGTAFQKKGRTLEKRREI